MLMRFDPFRDIDRAFQQLSQATQSASRSFPMDAYRRGDEFVVHFDLPGVDPAQIDITVDNNVLTVSAERSWPREAQDEVLVSERPEGKFTRQIMLGETLDTEQLKAGYQGGVLTLTIPVAERAKPRKIEITAEAQSPEAVDTTATPAAEQ
jgi:HSP20 family protein